MARNRNIVNLIAEVAVFAGLEIAAVSMLSHNGDLQNLWLARGMHTLNAGLWGSGESIGRYFSLGKENKALALENYELRQELRKYREDRDELLHGGLETVGHFKYIHSTVVKHSSNKQHNFIILDKGSEDGVSIGSGVITGKGVIGIVNATSRHYSYVMAFNNKDMAVSARIGKRGAIGPLSWDGISSRKAILNEIPHHEPIERGDTVYTSGYSAIFPQDIPLGLAGSAKIVNGAAYEIKVWLFEDLSRIRYVTIVENLDRDEIEELQQQ